jgi:hypothetical protein
VSKHALSGLLVLSVVTVGSPARATFLGPGSVVTPDAQGNPLSDPTATVLTSTTGAFDGAGIIQGTYNESVVRESSGTLDFVYQFTNSPLSLTSIERVTMYHFTGFTTDVGFVNGSGTQPPTSATSSPAGAVVGFGFLAADAVPAGGTSDLLIIRTNATQYDNTGTFTFQGGGATTVPGFAPSSVVVPEPSALALTGLGGFVMVVVAARRRGRTA